MQFCITTHTYMYVIACTCLNGLDSFDKVVVLSIFLIDVRSGSTRRRSRQKREEVKTAILEKCGIEHLVIIISLRYDLGMVTSRWLGRTRATASTFRHRSVRTCFRRCPVQSCFRRRPVRMCFRRRSVRTCFNHRPLRTYFRCRPLRTYFRCRPLRTCFRCRPLRTCFKHRPVRMCFRLI
jgi:hypothetical protein